MSSAIVIGGGFYGIMIANYLKTMRRFDDVTLLEKNHALMQQASYNNQARVHNGYHYPRSFTTAYRSRMNLPKFVDEFKYSLHRDFTKLYAIAKRNSKVTAKQFVRFCHEIGAKIEPAPLKYKQLFNNQLIEDLFLVEEFAFDSMKLCEQLSYDLQTNKVKVELNAQVKAISCHSAKLRVEYQKENAIYTQNAKYIFNCSYSGLNQFLGEFQTTQTRLKHEITEMGLIEVPSVLKEIGITVMDGPFFSIMPFPSRGLHSISHVRYTPHYNWIDTQNINPYQRLAEYNRMTRIERMIRDTTRYLPSINTAKYIESLYEIKTVLIKNESDDGRPILLEKHDSLPGFYSILGGKIDNIYDVLEKLNAEPLEE